MSPTASAAPRRYPAGHWLEAADPETVLRAGAAQAALGYSRIKNTFLFELLGDLSGKRLLDYGCGSGYFALEAARRGAARVVGLDARPPALAGAALLARREGAAGRLAFLAAEAPPFGAKARFEAVCLRDVIEHVEDDLGLVRRLAELLPLGGRLVLATQNSRSLNFLIEGGLRRLVLGQKNWLGWDPTHLRFYTPKSLVALVERAGLRVAAWRSAYLVPHKLPAPAWSGKRFWRLTPLAVLDRPLGRLAPFDRLGWSLMLGAVK